MKQYSRVWFMGSKKILWLSAVLFLAVLLGGCNQKDDTSKEKKEKEKETFIYYIDKNETKVEGQEYKPEATTKAGLVKEYLDALNTEPKDYALKTAIPDNVTIEKYIFTEEGLSLYFDSDYNKLSGVSEVLCRASIVKTLCQINGVDYVEFYVGGQPLMSSKENRLMKADDFIDDTSAENVYLTVYFANEKGNALVATNLKITYNGNVSIEKLILERLLEGPESITGLDDTIKKTIPSGTELLKVTTKDGICYVDLNDNFLNKIKGIKDEVILYSVVNSLVELSTINKVQFTIDGQTKKNFREDIPFDGLFERNLDLIAEGSK